MISGEHRRAVCLALVVLGALSAIAPGVAAAQGSDKGERLLPDLRTQPFSSIKLCQEQMQTLESQEACRGTGRTVLRTTSRIGNHGTGPLEMRANYALEIDPAFGEDCHGDGDVDLDGDGARDDDNDVWVSQTIARDTNRNGVFDREAPEGMAPDEWTSRVAGCRYYHPAHDHYHLEDFSKFELLAERTWKRRSHVVARGAKISFCVEDSYYFDLGLPGAPPPDFSGDPDYPDGQYRGQNCQEADAVAGISVGWYDQYGWSLSGQEIDVTGLEAGAYCLRTRADPPADSKPIGQLRESDEKNNSRTVRIRIDPAAAPVNAHPDDLEVVQLTNPQGELQQCRLGPRRGPGKR